MLLRPILRECCCCRYVLCWATISVAVVRLGIIALSYISATDVLGMVMVASSFSSNKRHIAIQTGQIEIGKTAHEIGFAQYFFKCFGFFFVGGDSSSLDNFVGTADDLIEQGPSS